MRLESGFSMAPNWSWIEKRQWRQNFMICRHRHFFDACVFTMSSLINGPSFKLISWLVLEFWQSSFIKDWPEMRKSEIHPSCVLLNLWRLWHFRDIIFATNISNKMLLTTAKCQGYNFYCFWVIKENQQGEIKLPPTMIRVKISYLQKSLASIDSFWLFTNIEKRYGISLGQIFSIPFP